MASGLVQGELALSILAKAQSPVSGRVRLVHESTTGSMSVISLCIGIGRCGFSYLIYGFFLTVLCSRTPPFGIETDPSAVLIIGGLVHEVIHLLSNAPIPPFLPIKRANDDNGKQVD